jgi:hypothetical protein
VITNSDAARQIVAAAPSAVDALIELFERDGLPGETAHERLKWILRLTAKGYPGMQMGLFPPDDSGFRPELADGRFYLDPRYWAPFLEPHRQRTKQVGHFLTAVGLCCNRWPTPVKIRLIAGHEKHGDHLFLTFLRQYLAATRADVRRFLAAVEADEAGDEAGRDALLRAIFGAQADALPDPQRVGNSVPDLRLSVKGWRFGRAIRAGRLRSRREAAEWLRLEIFDPARQRAALPRSARIGAN